MLEKSVRELGRHSLIYMVAWVVNGVLRLATLPIFTRYLDLKEYGALALLDTAVDVSAIVCALGLGVGMVRFYNETTDESAANKAISSGLICLWGMAAAAAPVLYQTRGWFGRILLGPEWPTDLVLLAFGGTIWGALRGGVEAYFTAKKLSVMFVAVDVLRGVLTVAVNLYLVVGLNLGLRGMLWGNFLVGGAVTVGLSIWVASRVGLSWDGPVVRRMLGFSLPTVPAMAAATGMHYIDRFFLRRYAGMGAVGLYAIAYQFPFMLQSMLGGSFERIWGASTVFTISRAPDATYQYSRVCTYVMTVLAFALLSLGISARSVVSAFAAPSYFQAAEYVPVIALGVWIYALHMFVRVGVVLSKRTHLFTVNYLAAFGVNVAANWILVPPFGAMGAAAASVVTYACFSLGGRILYRSCFELVFEWRRLITAGGLGMGLIALRSLIDSSGFWPTALVDLSAVTAYAAGLLFLPGLWTAGEKRAMRDLVQGGVRRWLPVWEKAN